MAFLVGVVFTVLLLCVLFIARILYVVKSGSNYKPGLKGRVAVLVVAGSGGHTSEILRLLESLSAAYTPRHYVIADSDRMSEEKICTFESSKPSDSESQFTLSRIPRSREVHQSWSSSVLSTLNALSYSLPLVFKLRPDVVLCNGPGTCIPLCVAGLLLGILGMNPKKFGEPWSGQTPFDSTRRGRSDLPTGCSDWLVWICHSSIGVPLECWEVRLFLESRLFWLGSQIEQTRPLGAGSSDSLQNIDSFAHGTSLFHCNVRLSREQRSLCSSLSVWSSCLGVLLEPKPQLQSISPHGQALLHWSSGPSSGFTRYTDKMTHFNKGPAYGLSAEVRSKIAQKYDPLKEEELRFWIEEVTGMPIGENFQKGLKDGVILCELINKLQPGSVKRINLSQLNWHKLENLGNFIKAILAYGLKPNDIFEANDLFENGNMTQVQTTLLALASMAKTKGMDTKIDIGVKYADKQARYFDDEKIKAGQCVIGLQMGTNKCASQAGMTAYGTRRHLYDPKTQTDKPYDQTTISLQMGTNKGASQAGMSAPGTRRDIFDQKVAQQPLDNSTISLQMGTNKVASQRGMSVYGLGRQVYDPKYCVPPTEPVIHANGSQGTGTNGSEISDSDYQVEFQEDEYHRGYHDDYISHYNEQGIDY